MEEDRYGRRQILTSILILTFRKRASGAWVDLVHVNVPTHDHTGVTEGWKKYYGTRGERIWRNVRADDPRSRRMKGAIPFGGPNTTVSQL
jgi:hypothetical protein